MQQGAAWNTNANLRCMYPGSSAVGSYMRHAMRSVAVTSVLMLKAATQPYIRMLSMPIA
jgi:hypothetical protein